MSLHCLQVANLSDSGSTAAKTMQKKVARFWLNNIGNLLLYQELL
jgi:hypothetical protein